MDEEEQVQLVVALRGAIRTLSEVTKQTRDEKNRLKALLRDLDERGEIDLELIQAADPASDVIFGAPDLSGD